MPPDGPTFLTLLKDQLDRLTGLITEFAKTAGEDREDFLKFQIEIEKRFGAIETAIAVSNTKILIYGGIGGVVGSAIVGAIVYSIFS